ncbi:MAG: hypothetical protein ABL895_14590 [Cyclobacteriaceae bacterium]
MTIKYRIIIVASSVIFSTFISCNKKTSTSLKKEDQIPVKEAIDSISIESIINHEVNEVDMLQSGIKEKEALREFEVLYYELLKFKDTENFAKYGFAIGGPYSEWMKKAENLDKKYDPKILVERGIFISELKLLGIYYVGSKGKETSETEFYNKSFLDGLSTNRKAEEKISN